MVINQLNIKRISSKFCSNDDLSLGKTLSNPMLVIAVKSVFQIDNEYYPQVNIHECRYKL